MEHLPSLFQPKNNSMKNAYQATVYVFIQSLFIKELKYIYHIFLSVNKNFGTESCLMIEKISYHIYSSISRIFLYQNIAK